MTSPPVPRKDKMKKGLQVFIEKLPKFSSALVAIGVVAGAFSWGVATVLDPLFDRVSAIEQRADDEHDTIKSRIDELQVQILRIEITNMLALDKGADGRYTGIRKEQIFELFQKYYELGGDQYITREIEAYSKAVYEREAN